MTNDGKENIRHVTCTNHAARSDKDLARVCPSKLSKREIEDLYFSLLENNTQLKKTINSQRDQIKVLTTKVHRMTVQKTPLGIQNKDCCASTKGILNEQKETIEDLKKANERLSDRIRLMNMRLCSAKQFLKRSPTQSTSHCVKCCLTPNQSIKNSSMSALNAKQSAANIGTEASSCQYLKGSSTIRAAGMESTEMKDDPCYQNKCRTVVDELKQKIENLEEELSKTHEQYSGRMRKLEEEMRELRDENLRVRALQVASKHKLELEEEKTGQLLHKLRDTEVQCDNLATDLQIEKSKVSELETQVKSANISSKVADALEKHLITMTNRRSSVTPNKAELPTLSLRESEWNHSPRVSNNFEMLRYSTEPEKERIAIKNSDDSGYADKFEDKKESPKSNKNILDQIASLQAQLNNLKLSMKESNNTGEHLKNVTVDPIRKNMSECNKTDGAVGICNLSKDISEPSKVKLIENIDAYASTSRVTEDPMSLQDINRSSKASSLKMLQQVNKFDPHKKVGEANKSSNNLSSSHQSNKMYSSSSFDKPFNCNRDVVSESVEYKRSNSLNISDNNPYVANYTGKTYNEIGYDKKRRRSSLRSSTNQDNNKDVSVSYDQNKTVVGSTVTIVDENKQTQESHDNGDPILDCEVSERNLKTKNHYVTESSNTPHGKHEACSEVKVKDSERRFDVNTDSNKEVQDFFESTNIEKKTETIKNGVQNLQDIIRMSKSIESPGTSSGNLTYTVEGGLTQGNVTKDPTYQVENENDATYQIQNGEDRNHIDLCESHARVCTCPRLPHRNVSIFRTCSGTLRFKTTTSAKNKFRQCRCVRDSTTEAYSNGCSVDINATTNGLATKPRSMLQPVSASTPVRQKTYNVEGSAEVTRSTSPDNTDHEISSLTDLPNEDKSPGDYISPGEEKATSTFTDSYAGASTTDYGSLSLGEVPMSGAKKLSDLEMRDKTTDSLALSTTSNKMEEALRAISDELTRCRELLQGQMPAQKPQLRTNSSMTEEIPIELRKAEGKARIGGASTPKCIFTVHVGTVVLSDQAVLCSRGKSLALSWQFYNQTATMTRLLAGRVMNVDYSTEYDLKITDHFLHYMKLEELSIIICEMEKQEEPFATCTLPLRDALLHTNRRVDMSLALVAGPQLLREQSMNEMEFSEEVGVLDIWCLLRVEPSALPAITSAIFKTPSPQPSLYQSKQHSPLMDQILDDEQSVDYGYSQDMRMRRRTPSKKSSDSTSIYDILKSKKWSRRRSSPIKVTRLEGNRQKSVSYDPKLPNDKNIPILEQKNEKVETLSTEDTLQSIDITVLWLALNEDCKAMTDPTVKRLYVAYSFLGRSGADLETPNSLPKPKHYMEKLHFMFKKTFTLNDCDLPLLGHLARCRQPTTSIPSAHDPKHCLVFFIVSEPPEDPLGLDSCEDIGFAYLYLGDVLACSAGAEQYTSIVAVHTAGQEEFVCGALAVMIDGLSLLRRCVVHSYSDRSIQICEST